MPHEVTEPELNGNVHMLMGQVIAAMNRTVQGRSSPGIGYKVDSYDTASGTIKIVNQDNGNEYMMLIRQTGGKA